jgi:NAD(P)-dependent dehydrogenase (short-subunit alcohol dehydrogenase family)
MADLIAKTCLVTGSSQGIGAAVTRGMGTFLFLRSEALSSYVTGQVIEVNGGLLMP